MLKYTGHPFYDIGVATICALVKKTDPSNIAEEDLIYVADYIEKYYTRDPLKSFLGVAFTTNAWFNQPAFEKQPEKRHDYANRILRSYNSFNTDSDQRCIFTGEPVTGIAFSDKLPAGRAYRQHVPLLTGEGVINFHPWGDTGLPISGKAGLCLQVFPLGCAKCGGKLLAVHSENSLITYGFAKKFLEENKRAMLLAQEAGSKKMPEAKMQGKTLLVDTFIAVERERAKFAEDELVSVTAYHFTNSGQSNALDEQNPPLSIYYLPLELTDFLKTVNVNSRYQYQWNNIVAKSWQVFSPNKKGKKQDNETEKPIRNYLYEDLFRLPDIAATFIRRYFLRIPARKSAEGDPRSQYSIFKERELVSWTITELFLRKVLRMDKQRINQIKLLGESLASYIKTENDKKFFTRFYSENKNYSFLRNNLIRVNLWCVKNGKDPLFTLESYLAIFEEGDEVARNDWRLARDLVLIKMIDELHNLDWFHDNKEVISEIEKINEEQGE